MAHEFNCLATGIGSGNISTLTWISLLSASSLRAAPALLQYGHSGSVTK